MCVKGTIPVIRNSALSSGCPTLALSLSFPLLVSLSNVSQKGTYSHNIPPLSLPLPALHSLSFPLGSTTFLSPPLFPLSRSFPLRAVVVVHDFETALSSANNGLKTTERVELVI